MTMIESFVKERNEALFSLDRRKIEAYLVKYGEGETAKAPDMLFWASVYNGDNCPFVLWIGTKRLIKRKQFDAYIDKMFSL